MFSFIWDFGGGGGRYFLSRVMSLLDTKELLGS